MRRMRLENEKDEDYKDICIDVRYFPKGFPSGNLPRVLSLVATSQKCAIYQVATSQMCNFPSGNFPSLA